MKTAILIFIIGYALPAVIALTALSFSKKGKLKFFAFLPIWNLIIYYHVAASIRAVLKNYLDERK